MTYDANELNSKHLTFFRFEDLRIYHKALDYILWVQKINQQFPESADKALSAAFCESARQIALRIAEGSAREKVQFILYLKEAKSAIRSCLVYTTIAYKHGYINDLEEDESRNQLMEMTKMLGALITSLQKGSNAQHDQLDEDLFPSKNW
jgi:four helix bundle protein